jgi:hypothetical protein
MPQNGTRNEKDEKDDASKTRDTVKRFVDLGSGFFLDRETGQVIAI